MATLERIVRLFSLKWPNCLERLFLNLNSFHIRFPSLACDGRVCEVIKLPFPQVQRQKLHLRGDVASTIVSMSLVEGMVRPLCLLLSYSQA